ncbi:MAG: glutamate ABC transporter substrate-binding protein [Acidimicrobiia bacterium]
MRVRASWTVLAVVVALAGFACGDDGDAESGAAGEEDSEQTTSSSTAQEEEAPEFPAGTAMSAWQEAGEMVVGTKFDQLGFGKQDPASGDIEGFDAEIARLVAAAVFGGTAEEAGEKIEFVEAVSKNREPFIQQGRVDLVIATYTINDTRKEVVDFAGPYFVARQDIMVKSDNTSIKTVDDLNGKKVCSVTGSTSLVNVQAKAPDADTSIKFDTYSECADAMSDGRVEAVTTDDTILAGLVQGSGGEFKLLEAPFSEEPYGIGLKKGNQELRTFLNDFLEEIFADGQWVDAFQNTLGKLGLDVPEPPMIDRY